MRIGRYTKMNLEKTKQELIRRGYKDPTDNEAIIYNSCGGKFLDDVVKAAFLVGYHEAEETMISRDSPNYTLIYKISRNLVEERVVDLLRDGATKNDIVMFPEGIIVLATKEKYATPVPEIEKIMRNYNKN